MENITKDSVDSLFGVVLETCEKMKDLPEPFFFATICTIIDTYAKEHGWSVEELEEKMEDMLERQKEIHAMMDL